MTHEKKGIFPIFNKNILEICHTYDFFQRDPTELISPYFNRTDVLVRINPFAELTKIIPVNRYSKYIKRNKLCPSGNIDNIRILPTNVYYLPGNYLYKYVGNLHYKSVKRAILKNNLAFDLIHAHFTWSAGYVGARLKEEYDKPLVITAHGYDIYDLPFRNYDWRKKIESVLNTADHIITVSNKNLEFINQLDVSTPVSVIPNGFRNDLFYPRNTTECRNRLKLPLDKKIILTVGNLEPVKGHKYLIEAIHKVIQQRKDILCIIVGSGSLHNSLKRQIKKLGLEDYVLLAGGRPHNEIPLWMNACDLFVLPSLNEGNPTVMFEALGCGKPFVGTKVGGIPEIIISNNYGLLSERGKSDELAEKILTSLGKNWNHYEIIEYSKIFTWINIADQLMAIYEKYLTGKSKNYNNNIFTNSTK
ncbi:glycosyltransferase family 4 protein [Methanoplanus limicola]|uniref:Glycosyl transferase group 1 n=1 Tax=Methanoplanus limicola DSM 2279 TaxID=937775 RepID=H1Z4E2_9EURY|nr:glycosyltransferase family 4 protein [Methanoplanus limicola]EHQ36690.1 glycosyl transferase group 1 [Methanoplanus limicola DSM 2279]